MGKNCPNLLIKRALGKSGGYIRMGINSLLSINRESFFWKVIRKGFKNRLKTLKLLEAYLERRNYARRLTILNLIDLMMMLNKIQLMII